MYKEINKALFYRFLVALNQDNRAEEKLTELVSSLMTLRKYVDNSVCDTFFLFDLNRLYVEKSNNLPINLKTSGKDIKIDIVKREVKILNYLQEREITIKLNNKLSDSLYDFLYELQFEDRDPQLDLKEIEEKYTIENDIDLSGC